MTACQANVGGTYTVPAQTCMEACGVQPTCPDNMDGTPVVCRGYYTVHDQEATSGQYELSAIATSGAFFHGYFSDAYGGLLGETVYTHPTPGGGFMSCSFRDYAWENGGAAGAQVTAAQATAAAFIYINQFDAACIPCAAGQYMYDDDSDSSTACVPCSVGYFAPQASVSCTMCYMGFHDEDSNPATPCDNDASACAAGHYADHLETGVPSCDICVAGRADLDGNSFTPCDSCTAGALNRYGILTGRPGTYAPSGSVSCPNCAAGRVDDDADSSTPCVSCSVGSFSPEGSTVCSICPVGFHDNDFDPATPCDGDAARCHAGHYSDAGAHTCDACAPGQADLDGNSATPCVACRAGTYVASGSVSCPNCAPGTYDDDADPSTPCVSCSVGSFSPDGSTFCIECADGLHDNDLDPSTPCDDTDSVCAAGHFLPSGTNTCETCAAGQADLDGQPYSPCVACAAGKYSGLSSTSCAECPAGTADHDQDPSTPCNACSPGTFSPAAATQCMDCPAGRTDHDSDPATACAVCGGTGGAAICAIAPDPCARQPCQNGGICHRRGADYVCDACPSGYDGRHCTDRVVPCEPLLDDCDPNAVCIGTGPGQHICHCNVGFSGGGLGSQGCMDMDECASQPCANGGVCSDSTSSAAVPFDAYHCDCAPGWACKNCDVRDL